MSGGIGPGSLFGPMRYQGRLWDAPAFDDAVQQDLTEHVCIMCTGEIEPDDNACLTPVGQYFHLECWLRPVMGSIAHLEGRCSCFGGTDDHFEGEQLPYRDDARATLQWLIDHQKGRFADD